MDQIVAELLAGTGALGVWLLGPMVVVGNEPQNVVLASAVTDPSLLPPATILVEDWTCVHHGDHQLFAEAIGGVLLVVMFDERSSLGLIRLRVRRARDAISRVLAWSVPPASGQ